LKKRAVVAALALLSIYSAAHFAASGVVQPLHNFASDFLSAFPSYRLTMLLGRSDVYVGSSAERWAWEFRVRSPMWHYGPLFHAVTFPLFAFGDLHAAYLAWLGATYAFLLAALAIAMRAFDLRGVRWIALIGILNFVPLYEAVTQRNIEVFELMLLFGAFALLRKGRQAPAGVLIGLAAMTKFLPLIFLPYFAIKRMWNALLAAIVTIVPVVIGAQCLFGWSHSGIVIQLREGSFVQSALNQSVSGMIIRLMEWSGTYSLALAATLSRMAMVAGLAGVSWLFVKARNCEQAEDLEWSVLIAAMVLLPPHNQQYYFLLLLFPFLALLARRVDLPWLAASFVLVGAPVPFRLFGANAFQLYLAWGIPFVGAAILTALSVRALRHAPCT
jgi:hypothetical protein